MLTAARFPEHSKSIIDPSITHEDRKDLIHEVREATELVYSQEYSSFLTFYLPAFQKVLTILTKPQFTDNVIHKTRALILEILNRLPNNEVLRPKFLVVFTMAIETLRTDNEENAVTAIHIIFDLHKNYRNHLNTHVQPFLDFVRHAYESFRSTVQDLILNRSNPQNHQQSPLKSQQGQQVVKQFAPSYRSFKVITECPLLVMFVFQLYTSLIEPNIHRLLPLMITAIDCEVPVHIITTPQLRSTFNEFISAQVKTVSFVAYLLKQYPALIRNDDFSIPRGVVKLLQACRATSLLTRKELLVATRHILNSRYRKGFFPRLDLLLDENTLLGTNKFAADSLRPLAYSFLADLIHNMRLSLTIPQLEKIIFLFSTNLHDPKFSYSLQTNAVRLLLNLMEGILKIDHDDVNKLVAARQLLIRILEALAAKCQTLGDQVPRLLASVESARLSKDSEESGRKLSDLPVGDPLKEVSEFKTLLRTVTSGLKTLIWSSLKLRAAHSTATIQATAQQTTNQEPRNAQQNIPPSSLIGNRVGLLEKECETVSLLMQSGVRCLRLYARCEKANGGTNSALESTGTNKTDKHSASNGSKHHLQTSNSSTVAATEEEEKDIIEHFSQIFTVLDPRSFQDIFGHRIVELFEAIIENPALMAIPQHFLTDGKVCKYFADILLNFLVGRIQYLDVPIHADDNGKSEDVAKADTMLRLFKVLFASAKIFPHNEPVVRLHIGSLVKKGVSAAKTAKEPYRLLLVLRALFKYMSSCKQESKIDVLYRNFGHMVDPLLTDFLMMYEGPNSKENRDLLVELCLSIPAKPSTLFPCLDKQIRPVLWALQSETASAADSLKTLEFWIEILQPEYLETLLAPVEPDLTRALYKHLRPAGNVNASSALRILGKLGSKSRKIETMSTPLTTTDLSGRIQQIKLKWTDNTEMYIETDALVSEATKILLQKNELSEKHITLEDKAQAWTFLFSCLLPFVSPLPDSSNNFDHQSSNAKLMFPPYSETSILSSADEMESNLRRKSKQETEGELHLVTLILTSLISSSQIPGLSSAVKATWESTDDADYGTDECIHEICSHFAYISLQENDKLRRRFRNGNRAPQPMHTGNSGSNSINHTLFLDTLISAMSSEDRIQAKGGLHCMQIYFNALLRYTGIAEEKSARKMNNSRSNSLHDPSTTSSQSETREGSASSSFIKKQETNFDKMQVDAGPEQQSDINKAKTVSSQVTSLKEGVREKNLQSFLVCTAGVLDKLSHLCYKYGWNGKESAVAGIRMILTMLPSDVQRSASFLPYFIQLLRAIIFLIQDSSHSRKIHFVKGVQDLLDSLLRTCFRVEENESRLRIMANMPKVVKEVTRLLIRELYSQSQHVREAVKRSLKILGECLKRDPSDFLITSKEQLLSPFQQRPLRCLPVRTQIGHLDCINFCLELGKPFVPSDLLSSPIRENLLFEAVFRLEMLLVETGSEHDDRIRERSADTRDSGYGNQNYLLKYTLLELLSNTVIHCGSTMQENKHAELVGAIISSLFQTLQSRDDEVIQHAKRGLRQVISTHPEPKKLLMQHLRSLLDSLSDFNKLNTPYVRRFSKVLELFSHYFNVTLGDKLLDHLQKWTEPEKLVHLKGWTPGTESIVGAAILDLFHLLPPRSNIFVSRLIPLVIQLESALALAGPGVAHLGLRSVNGASISPYRKPLLNFCNKHPKYANDYFLSYLEEDDTRQLFFVLLQSEESKPMHVDLTSSPNRLPSATFVSATTGGQKSLYVAKILSILAKSNGKWLGTDQYLIKRLIARWKVISVSPDAQQQKESTTVIVREIKIIAEVLVIYCSNYPDDVKILFELIPVFIIRTTCDFTFVKDFLQKAVTTSSTKRQRKLILTTFLALFRDENIAQEYKVYSLQQIIIPMISHHLETNNTRKVSALNNPTEIRNDAGNETEKTEKNIIGNETNSETEANGKEIDDKEQSQEDEVLDNSTVQHILEKLLIDPSKGSIQLNEQLSAELLRLVTVLIEYLPKEPREPDKQKTIWSRAISFGWQHLKREESISKYWAFVTVSTFLATFANQAPVRLILQVYIALLRAFQGDGRELVQKALDILIPAVRKKITHNSDEHKYPTWIRYTRKILLDHSHTIPHLIHIWHLICRHSSLFFVARAQFVPAMVNSLQRIGLNQSASAENRRLAIDVVDVIIHWEQTRRKAQKEQLNNREAVHVGQDSKKRAREESDDNAQSSNSTSQLNRPDKLNQLSEPPAKTRKSSEAQSITTANSPATGKMRDVDDFRPSQNTIDHLVNFLIQVSFKPADPRERTIITRRCVKLLEKALTLWPQAVVRFSFIEKLLPTISNALPGSAVPNSNRSSANPTGPDASAPDNSRGTTQRNGKTEQQIRQKQYAVRGATITTALSLTPILVEKQGVGFLKGNMNAVRAMVAPALLENHSDIAAQFGSLLTQLSKKASQKSNQTTEKTSPTQTVTQVNLQTQEKSIHGNLKLSQTENTQPRGDSLLHGLTKSKSETVDIQPLYVSILQTIDVCLKSGDTLRTHCGLIALQALTSETQEYFPKYQELLTKVILRLAKEKPTAVPNAVSSGNQISSTLLRNGNATSDRSITDGVGQKPNRQINIGQNISVAETMNAAEAAKVRQEQEQDARMRMERHHNTMSLIIGLSMLSENILTIEPSQRKSLFQILAQLIEKSSDQDILLRILKIVENWIFWKGGSQPGQSVSQKEPLSAKDKTQILLKMVSFERLTREGSQVVKLAYLRLILRIYGVENPEEKRAELTPKLERAFMMGLKSTSSPLYEKFFAIYNNAVVPSMPIRLNYVFSKQDWYPLADKYWIAHATELLLATVDESQILTACSQGSKFASFHPVIVDTKDIDRNDKSLGTRILHEGKEYIQDDTLLSFRTKSGTFQVRRFVHSLRKLVRQHPQIAVAVWVSIVPKQWSRLSFQERLIMEKSLAVLLTKEYHQTQMTWPTNCIQALLQTAIKCEPLPPISSSLVVHLGARWNAWHDALSYLEIRGSILKAHDGDESDASTRMKEVMIAAELNEITDAQTKLYDFLHEDDYACGVWKRKSKNPLTRSALTFQQTGFFAQAQDLYSDIMMQQISTPDESRVGRNDQLSKSEYFLCENRWTECARMLCQWDILNEFSRSSSNTRLLHECLWRIPEWNGLRELLIKDPIDDEPQLKLYQAYMNLQENKLDQADSYILQGYQKALERFCSLTEVVDPDEHGHLLVQFQQLVELQESSRIFTELNALSRQSSASVNIEQKIDSVRLTINTWRERLPSRDESLRVWSDVLTWRNHVHAVIVNVLEALKDAANAKVAAAQGGQAATSNRQGNGVGAQNASIQAAAAIAKALPQQVLVMGVNETAWNVHRFAKACRQQGFSEVSVYALQKLYPFGTMELTEYFVKTKEIARSFRDGPIGIDKGIESGLKELGRCNMEHFNQRQKAQLFTLKAKLFFAANREKDAVDALYHALSISTDVGGTWLAWGQYCDEQHKKLLPVTLGGVKNTKSQNVDGAPEHARTEDSVWREAAVNCYLQSVRFGSRKARNYLPRVLRLLTIDSHRRYLQATKRLHDKTKMEDQKKQHVSDTPSVNSKLSVKNKANSTRPVENENSAGRSSDNRSMKIDTKLKTDSPVHNAQNNVSDVFTSLSNHIPGWMWISWLPQLITMLSRPEAIFIRPILLYIAQRYPQAILIPMRAFIEERLQIEGRREQKFHQSIQMNRQMTSFIRSPLAPSELSQVMRQSYGTKDKLQRLKQKATQLKLACNKEKEYLSATSVGSQEHTAHLTKHRQLEEERSKTEKHLQHFYQLYANAQKKQKQLSDALNGVDLGNGGLLPSSHMRTTDIADPSQQSAQNRSTPEVGSANTSQHSVKSGDARPADRQTKQEDQSEETHNSASSSLTEQKSENTMTPLDHADVIMTQIVKNHYDLYNETDRTITAVVCRMGWQREEQLFSLISALLHRCYPHFSRPKPEILNSCRTALEEVSRRCFNTGQEGKGPNEPKNFTSISDLKESFEAELAPQTAKNFPTDMESLIVRLRRWRNILQRRVNALQRTLKLEIISHHLLELDNSNIEVFGQYSKPLMVEPQIQYHPKIKRICPDIHVIQRPSNPSRGISIIGSDGKRHVFLLETVGKTQIPSTEERTAQISNLLNTCIFAKDSTASKRKVQVSVPTFVALGSRSRLISHDFSSSVFSEGLERHLEENGQVFDDPVVKFRSLTREYDKSRKQGGAEPTTRADIISARVAAYHSLGKSDIPDSCFSKWVDIKMQNTANCFFFKKRFAQSLGIANLLTYALAIGARRPQNLTFSWSTGTVQNLQMRSLISPEGTVTNDEAVPFRLTRNILQFLGTHGVDGPFSGSMLVTLSSLQKHADVLSLFLEVILRDELQAWSNSKADHLSNRDRGKTNQLEIYHRLFGLVENCLNNSMNAIFNRLQLTSESSSPLLMNRNVNSSSTTAGHGYISTLIRSAVTPENLAQMDANWHAWY